MKNRLPFSIPLGRLMILFCLLLPASTAAPAKKVGEIQRLYPYGGPVWKDILAWGNPYSREEFETLFNEVYGDIKSASPWIIPTDKGLIYEEKLIPWKTPPRGQRLWRTVKLLPPLQNPDLPLEGLRIAIDPGHIGGRWGKMEQRDNLIADRYRVQEGVSTRIVAEILSKRLKSLGAIVMLTRTVSEPVSPLTLDKLAAGLSQKSGTPVDEALRDEAKRLLMRPVEINARAALIRRFRPDITLCLHFDAPSALPYTDQLHLIVNGAYLPSELADADQRFSLLEKLLSKTHEEEVALSSAVARAMAEQLDLPAFQYSVPQERVRAVTGEPYLWHRNLLANCLYGGPVVYTEPYNMSRELTARRLSLGDYEGTRIFDGKPYRSIYREYADSVAEGLKRYYTGNRTRPPAPQESDKRDKMLPDSLSLPAIRQESNI